MEADAQIKTRNWIIAVAMILIAVLAVALFISRQQPRRADSPASRPADDAAVQSTAPLERRSPPAVATPPTPTEQARRRWVEKLGFEPEWPRDLSSPQDCERVEQDLERLCVYIDSRQGVRQLAEGYGSCDLLRQAAEELGAAPPRISSELRSYERLLANVFFLSRVFGSERLRLPVLLLAEHPELAEPLALALYRWAVSREGCVESSPVTPDALYSYAGFLLNTMGGQAYLRRRTPRVEGLSCFYALEIIDAAERRDHNPDGLDPRPEIARCRALIATQPLVFADAYLSRLDDLARRWEARR